jgi:hypothetical protein
MCAADKVWIPELILIHKKHLRETSRRLPIRNKETFIATNVFAMYLVTLLEIFLSSWQGCEWKFEQ